MRLEAMTNLFLLFFFFFFGRGGRASAGCTA
jgi:hypothetical protein